MIPQQYQFAAAIIFLVGGVLACFAGYRLFRVVLVVYGFILGALLASSAMEPSDTTRLILAAVGGGLVGALILFLAYFVGVALLGAGIGALFAHLIWTQLSGDPHPLVVIGFSTLGAIGAMWLQRYVIIVATAFGGAWTVLVGALALLGDRTARRAAEAGNVWIVYPFNPAPGQRWILLVWLALALAGLVTQLGVTGKRRT